MSPSTSIAIGSTAVAAVALIVAAVSAIRLRAIRSDQRVLLGDSEHGDLIALTAAMERRIASLESARLDESSAVSARFTHVEKRISSAVSGVSLVRYDAFDEGSGQQSFTLAMVDEEGTGVVISSLVRRESARVYAQRVTSGTAERTLSPEEREAVNLAIAEASGT